MNRPQAKFTAYQWVKSIVFFSLSIAKGFGSALIILSSLIISVLLIRNYHSAFDFSSQIFIIDTINNFKMYIFWGTWIYSIIINHKEITKNGTS